MCADLFPIVEDSREARVRAITTCAFARGLMTAPVNFAGVVRQKTRGVRVGLTGAGPPLLLTEPMGQETSDGASARGLPLPPGRSGLPYLGELPAFLKDGFGFVESRVRQHGPVFRTKILGRATAVISGPDASGRFIDQAQIQRGGAMPAHIQTLFGGRALPVLDGDEHHERKAFVMSAFTPEALAGYLPRLHEIVRSSLGASATGQEIRWFDGLKRLALECICTTILGLPAGPTFEAVARDYEDVVAGFTSLPVPLPGTKFTKAKQALARILAVYGTNVRDHLATPQADGLGHILAARSPRDGRAITVEEAQIELHHIVVAGLIVWAWFVTAAVELDRHADVRERLRAEVASLPPGPLTLEAVAGATYLNQVTMEIRRLSPVVQVFFGQARQDIAFAGHRIPAGWMVLWGIRSSHLRAEIYKNPEAFDPERFSRTRHEQLAHPYAFVPNGAGSATHGHKCAGYEFAPLLLQVFLVELLRGGLRWTLTPGQDLSLDMSLVPPVPRDGLKTRLTRA
jgi:retinoid hydroxylase